MGSGTQQIHFTVQKIDLSQSQSVSRLGQVWPVDKYCFSVSTTNQQNLSTVKIVDLRKSHLHQQNWSIVQIVDSLLDPNQQSVSLKIGETTKCTLGFFLHNNKFVDQQSGSNVQIVVSGPTSTNCVIPNLPRGSCQLYRLTCGRS